MNRHIIIVHNNKKFKTILALLQVENSIRIVKTHTLYLHRDMCFMYIIIIEFFYCV